MRRRDAGNATVEFLGVALLLLVPLVYLVLVLGQVQGAAMAADSAARGAARVFAATEPALAGAAAQVVTDLALTDHGLADHGALSLACSADPCHTPGAAVTAVVEIDVPLLGVPDAVRGAVPLVVPVSARATAALDDFRAWP